MRELWLVRHGETSYNAEGRIQGHLDVPLSAPGRRQAARLAARLAETPGPFTALFTSDLIRTRETAQPIATALNLNPCLTPLLREVDVGLLAGLVVSEGSKRFPGFAEELRKDPWNTPRPEGESMAGVAVRLSRLLSSLGEGRFLLVTHGGVVRAALAVVLDLPGTSVRRFRIGNTSITRLAAARMPGQAIVIGDVGHLEGWSTVHSTADDAELAGAENI